MDRSTFIKGMIPDMHEWYWEAADPFYKLYTPMYPRYFTQKPISDIKGAFKQMTSAIAVDKLEEKKENGPIKEYHAIEGFTVYIAKKSYYGKSPVSFELNEDFDRVKNFIRDGDLVDVVGWWRDELRAAGLTEIAWIPIEAGGLGYGANREARVKYEYVLVWEKR